MSLGKYADNRLICLDNKQNILKSIFYPFQYTSHNHHLFKAVIMNCIYGHCCSVQVRNLNAVCIENKIEKYLLCYLHYLDMKHTYANMLMCRSL